MQAIAINTFAVAVLLGVSSMGDFSSSSLFLLLQPKESQLEITARP